METKKSKVIAVTVKKEGTSQQGKPYVIYFVVFENNDSGDYIGPKDQKTFIQGQEAEYTKEVVQNGQYTNTKIKPLQAAGGKGFYQGSPTAQNKRTALECAVSLVVAGKWPEAKVLEAAGKFDAWLNGGASEPKAAPAPSPTNPVSSSMSEDLDGGLPF